MIQKIIDFFRTEIWRIRSATLSPPKSLLLQQLRIIVLAIRGFDEDRCTLRASALTFYTLLSIVPVVAMLFGIAKGFGFENMLEQQILTNLQWQPDLAHKIIEFANSMLENTRGGLIAGIGIGVLFWTVLKLLGHIEHSFNAIWGITRARSLARKFSDYMSAMLICPVLLIMASSLTVIITSQIEHIVQKLALLQTVSPFIFAGLKLLPYGVIWLLFSFLYMFIPNTRVKPLAGIVAGIIAGTLYQLVQLAYISFQVGVAKYNAIYGGFAALPLFLIWLETSWVIVLLGAEISFACQNVKTYEFEPDCLHASHSLRKLLALTIARMSIDTFEQSAPAPTAAAISTRLGLPIRLTNSIIDELTTAGILSQIQNDPDEEFGLQPARDPQQLTIGAVFLALEKQGTNTAPIISNAAFAAISDRVALLEKTIESAPDNVALKDIAI